MGFFSWNSLNMQHRYIELIVLLKCTSVLVPPTPTAPILAVTSGQPLPHLFTLCVFSCAWAMFVYASHGANCSMTYGDVPPYGHVLLFASVTAAETRCLLLFLDDWLHVSYILTRVNWGQSLQMCCLFFCIFPYKLWCHFWWSMSVKRFECVQAVSMCEEHNMNAVLCVCKHLSQELFCLVLHIFKSWFTKCNLVLYFHTKKKLPKALWDFLPETLSKCDQ